MSTCHSSHIARHVDNIALQDAEFRAIGGSSLASA